MNTKKHYYIEIVMKAYSMDEAMEALRGINPEYETSIVSSNEGDKVEQ